MAWPPAFTDSPSRMERQRRSGLWLGAWECRRQHAQHSMPADAPSVPTTFVDEGGRWPIATIVTKCCGTGSSASCLGCSEESAAAHGVPRRQQPHRQERHSMSRGVSGHDEGCFDWRSEATRRPHLMSGRCLPDASRTSKNDERAEHRIGCPQRFKAVQPSPPELVVEAKRVCVSYRAGTFARSSGSSVS